MRIDVRPHEPVTVVVPPRTNPRLVREFVDKHSEWIKKTRAQLARRYPAPELALPLTLRLPAIHQTWPVQYEPATGAAPRCRDTGDLLVVRGRAAGEAAVRQALRRWLIRHARQHLVPWLRGLARETGFTYRKTQIRGQRTLWGSCSATGTISLNYCLLFLEREVVRYLLLHELCHTRHMNHSRRFWELLEQFEPDCRALDKKLSAAWTAVPGWVLARP